MSRRIVLTFLTCFLLAPAMLRAQPAPDGGNAGGDQGNRRNRGGGGGGNGQDFRQQFMDRIKEQMGAKDDEWKVIEPKLTKVMDAQRASRGGGFGFGGFGGRGGGGGGGNANRGGGNADTPTAKAMQDLRETLDNKDASADDIAKKLTALRDAREKSKAELQAAQKDLKEILTQRQEAVLVMMGQME
jgi:hypothetical protein